MIRIILTLSTLLAAEAIAQDAIASRLFPQANKLGHLEWIQPGMRITYFSVEGPLTARRGGPTGSRGHVQVDVVAVEPKGVVVNVRTFVLPNAREGGPAKIATQSGALGPPASVADYWVHPKALAAASAGNLGGDEKDGTTTIKRIVHNENEKKYQATRVDYVSRKHVASYVWDNRSDVLLYVNSETPREWKRFLNYRSARQLKLQWAKSPMPGWLARVKRMEFVGVTKTPNPGGFVALEAPRAMRYDFLQRGSNWTRIKVTSVAGGLNDLDRATARAEMTVCAGPGMIGGSWIPPAGLAKLTIGQVIDRDRHTQFTTTVAHAGMRNGRNVVVIAEENDIQRIEYHYDASSGGLVRLRGHDKTFGSDTVLRLQGTK